jgi:2-polyprenyl-3-methyl-5-hydroxy-6-metoxy-1,4-benzoquinol methylase
MKANHRLIQADGGDGKVYLVDLGRRRWLKDVGLLESINLKWPDDVSKVSQDEIIGIPLGPPLPVRDWNHEKPAPSTMEEAREYLVSRAFGTGIEFGAAANPMPIPVGVRIRYADLFATPVLEEELYGESGSYEYVPLDIQSSFDAMAGVRKNSLDFIIASHVIDHVRDPIGAILLSMSKLRSGGRLLLVVPKMERTLDSKRSLTSLEHVILDHTNPSRERDALHVVEFHAYAKPEPLEEVYEKAMQSIHDDYHSMHYHVWNEKNFQEMLEYGASMSGEYTVELFIGALPGSHNYEFYVSLKKV